jgi:Fe-S cluster biogenesis protein NfuA/nitrite reductase/ring-hydroxylating ferredoxin subunit
MDDAEVRAHVARTESLLARLESGADPAAAPALEAVEALVQLYGEALARVMTHATRTGLAGALVDDEVVSHLLLVHGLHPVDVHTRVARALDEVRPYLRSHGGGVDLLEVRDGVARLRLDGSCRGCPSSRATMRAAIEDAVRRAAPELEGVEADGVDAAPADGPPAGLAWTVAGALADLAGDAPRVRRVNGEPVLFLRVDGAAYAYAPACPACGASLEAAALVGADLCCPACGGRYDVRQAGRPLDGAGARLEPIPLLVGDAGVVRVAVRARAA